MGFIFIAAKYLVRQLPTYTPWLGTVQLTVEVLLGGGVQPIRSPSQARNNVKTSLVVCF